MIDVVAGLSSSLATTHSDVACGIRFKLDGTIVARNGGAWSTSTINYIADTSYSFRLVVDVPSHTYSIYVTPQGGSELTIGTDYDFRTEQASISSLAYWNLSDVEGNGTATVCNFELNTFEDNCLTSSASYQSQSFEDQTDTFEATFDVTPLADGIDAVTGLSTIAATGHSDVACIVRFKYDNVIYARNGGTYESPSAISYTANTTYSFRMVIDIAAHTYSLYVTPEGGSELTVGEDFAFRTEQAGASSLAYLNIVDVDGVDETLEVCDLTVIPLGASCLTSSASYQSQSFDSQAGTFEATFDATPLADGIDAVTGLSTIAATGHSDVACIVRFKYDSIIYARNGSSYESPSAIPYTANTTYSFRMVVDIAAHTYSLYVTPEGGSELTVGEDFAFRTEQAGASSLAYLNIVDVDGVDGTLEVCNLVIDHNGSVRIDAPLGIALGKGNSSFMLFPNPARATLFLSLGEGPGSQGAIEVYTLQGIKIYQTSQKVSFPYKVDVSSYTPGIYIVKVELNGKYFTQKLVKE
ncbi:MAG: hypothetical protein CL946_04115 [Ectothiorhodospiraceae bacterium]|nr:hypothetical protein [Ectothiorhodospiraceae bacterium]